MKPERRGPSVVAIIQARMGSTRLPGKVLMDLAGRPVLERVVSRVRRCREVDEVVVATPALASDDEIARECARMDVKCYRGDESDVLERYRGAAEASRADVCVRISADCPLIDPGVSDSIVSRFMSSSPRVSYASNKIPPSFPRGLDTEVFGRDTLERAAREARQQYEREHVTPYIYRNPEFFSVLSITSDVDRAAWRWTVDTPQDLSFVRAVYDHFAPADDFSWIDVVDLVESNPELMLINSGVEQKQIEEG